MVTTTLFCVLRNAGFSILVGWVFGYCYTVGNVASGKPPAEQSYASYVAANGALYHGVFSAAIVVMFSVHLTPEKFVLQPPRNASTSTEPASRTLSLAQCCFKLLYHMTPHLIFSTTAEVVGCYMLIKYLPPSGRKYKPAMYLSSFWGNFVLASAEYCKRNIFNYETVRGLAPEIYSDMYAEYMAMGCSYAIMFFFWNHPQYQFIESPSEKSEATQRFHQFLLFAFQVSVEVVVDFIACNIEVMQGIDFNSFDQNDPFLTFFMSVLAFGNVSISAGLYIHS
ncbi:hypothetical protein PRNP1_003602 [Phytophthora ramorum]